MPSDVAGTLEARHDVDVLFVVSGASLPSIVEVDKKLTLDDLPVFVGQLELAAPLADFEMPEQPADAGFGKYRRARITVLLHDFPLGYILLPAGKLTADEVAAQVWRQLADELNEHLASDDQEPLTTFTAAGVKIKGTPKCMVGRLPRVLPFASVTICTRNRTAKALNVVRNALALDYDNFEVVVIDNSPSDNSLAEAMAKEFADNEKVRYVLEPRPGVSFARNRGWQEARGEIVAYADDDVVVDTHWLKGVVTGFNRTEHVGCVTGFVPSSELNNKVQLFFDSRVAWGNSRTFSIFDMKENRKDSPLYPFAGSDFGTGANFSFLRAAIEEVGGFDELLGAGVPTGGGEDLDAFVKILLGGWALVYEPTAMISHIHRSDEAALNRQIWTYGTGLTAFIFKYLLNRKTGPGIIKGIPAGLKMVRSLTQKSTASQTLPKTVAYREVVGMMVGPFLYIKARWLTRR